jgi:hypothetical protein
MISEEKMKLADRSLSVDLQTQDRVARAMAVVGEALVKASAILQGKVTSDYARPAMMASSAGNVTINALRAVREDGGRLRLPPFFELKQEPDEHFRLNEPKPPNKARK